MVLLPGLLNSQYECLIGNLDANGMLVPFQGLQQKSPTNGARGQEACRSSPEMPRRLHRTGVSMFFTHGPFAIPRPKPFEYRVPQQAGRFLLWLASHLRLQDIL